MKLNRCAGRPGGAEGEGSGNRHGALLRRSAAAPPRLGQRHPGRPGQETGLTPQAIGLLERGERRRPHAYTVQGWRKPWGSKDEISPSSRRRRAALRRGAAVGALPSRPSRAPDAAGRTRAGGGGRHGPLAPRGRAPADPDRSRRRRQDPAGPGGGGRSRLARGRSRTGSPSCPWRPCGIPTSSRPSSPRRSGSGRRRTGRCRRP